MNPDESWTKAQIGQWLRQNGIRPRKRMTKSQLLALVPNNCPADSECGHLANFIAHIFNQSGTFGRGPPISDFLVPAILSSAGNKTIFGGDLSYNGIFRDGKWEGAILGDTSAPIQLQKAAQYGASHNDSSGEQKVIDRGALQDIVKSGSKLIPRLREHLDRMREDPDAPNYYVHVDQNHYHYNMMMLARNDDGSPVAYYYEPHNEYTNPELVDSGLPYGLAAVEFERILGMPLVYGACGQYPVHQGDDDLCQSWAVWFAYLLASGMSYDEAQRFVKKEHIGGLLAFQMYCFTVHFTARSYKGTPVFTGTLERGTLFGKPISIKSIVVDQDEGRLDAIGLGDTTDNKFATRNMYRGGGRYSDRTGLL